ncbi:hypothetical protein CLHOM_26390 [Clostridium homopropionicum DSM 5847]|uniref:Uncharacterized protein n=1 Tax=Clostridium homopropionicum DSM 5847 TaxID=1121318 RepID=A0A0L6Z7F9_9CLOT|nr:hypothetical protein [Clostridium homopropionicum]KOA18899.1 hypothetical protein CLHOM_26390 [Clostridium homopropionicum DSM 5847]SFG45145.1 hypothetical protein SAMN04488501_109116 [Clostridium homopropionicum]
MKVFTVKKEKEETLDEKTFGVVSSLNFKGRDNFNYIIIENPSDSRKIYIIKNLDVMIRECNNELSLMQGETDKMNKISKMNGYKKLADLNLFDGIEKNNNNEEIELVKNIINQNKRYNILNDSALIMLPGGCLSIKLKKEVSDLDININWTSDDIYNS